MEKRLRIGFVTTSLSSIDGWGRYSKCLVESVAAHADVIVLTTRSAQNECDGLFPVHVVLPRASFNPINQLVTCIQAIRFFLTCDVVHTLIEPYAPAVAFAAWLCRAKFVMTLHGTYSVPPARLSFRRFALIFAYHRTAITTTGSRYTEIKTREQVKFGECRFIPNGVDTVAFHPLTGVSRLPFFMTVGAVKPRKGQLLCVSALGLLKDEFPNLSYVVVGDLGNTRYVDEIQTAARQLGMSERIQLRGRISDNELVQLYNETAAMILAATDDGTDFEGFPMVFYEANACGAPAISTRGFGSEYALKDGYNGFVIEPNSPQAIAEVLRKILTDPALQTQLTAGAYVEAAAHSWSEIAKQLMQLYQDSFFI